MYNEQWSSRKFEIANCERVENHCMDHEQMRSYVCASSSRYADARCFFLFFLFVWRLIVVRMHEYTSRRQLRSFLILSVMRWRRRTFEIARTSSLAMNRTSKDDRSVCEISGWRIYIYIFTNTIKFRSVVCSRHVCLIVMRSQMAHRHIAIAFIYRFGCVAQYKWNEIYRMNAYEYSRLVKATSCTCAFSLIFHSFTDRFNNLQANEAHTAQQCRCQQHQTFLFVFLLLLLRSTFCHKHSGSGHLRTATSHTPTTIHIGQTESFYIYVIWFLQWMTMTRKMWSATPVQPKQNYIAWFVRLMRMIRQLPLCVYASTQSSAMRKYVCFRILILIKCIKAIDVW